MTEGCVNGSDKVIHRCGFRLPSCLWGKQKGAPGTHTGVRLGTHTHLRARVSPAPFCDSGTVSVGNPTPQGIRLGNTRLRVNTGKE